MLHIGDIYVSPWAALLVLTTIPAIWGLGWAYQRYKFARYVVPFIPTLCGVWIGLSALTAPHGYVAAYSFVAAWALAALVFLAGGLLCLVPSARRFGLAGLIASCALLASFYVTYGIGTGIKGSRQDKVVKFGPDVKSDLVILFKSETDRRQIDAFDENVLYEPDYGRGHSFRPGIGSILSVSVGHHSGYAIMFSPSIKESEKTALMQRITLSPIVYKLFRGIAANEILPETVNAPPNPATRADN